MSKLYFQQLIEYESNTYTYLLADAGSKEAVLIDTTDRTVERDLNLLKELGFSLKYTLDTHIHADHITGAATIKQATAAQTVISQASGSTAYDIQVAEGDSILFGGFALKVLATPGHTDSCVSYYCEAGQMVFTGDALLIRGCGRTDFQQGNAETLFSSVRDKIFTLPEATLIYPAHDYKGMTVSSVALEKMHNPRLKLSNSAADFVTIMDNLNLANPKRIDESVPANMKAGAV